LGLGTLFSVLFLAGCPIADGFLSVQGVVYAWVDAPADAEGRIYISEAIPTNIRLLPLEGVYLWVISNVSEADLLSGLPTEQALDISGPDGRVAHSGSAPTGEYHVGIKVALDGYQPATQIVPHRNDGQDSHDFVAILVAESSR